MNRLPHFPYLVFRSRFWSWFMVLGLWSCQQQEQISFNEQIRPILNENCLVCHGGVRQLGGFSLLFPETAFSPTESGKLAIVPGNHQKSELYRRLINNDPDMRMPQESPPLTEEQISLIARWIDQGAKWEDHWAYVPPQPQTLPQLSSPWVRDNMDLFILRDLHQMGLEPAEEADAAALIRRASLDLTGLPPSEDLQELFLTPDAHFEYEVLLDSLLASPHYGERWAAMWLDLARYADSNGYETDNHRNIWRFRDWVIQAFNNDLPFDQFTIEQLAGDMLPQPTRDQLIATAFHRNAMTNTEGGTIDEEFRMASVIDRLNTTFEVWQSTSIGCVQCHSHPYDPFKHEEYYQLMAYFNNTQDADLASLEPTLATWETQEEGQIREIIEFIGDLPGGPAIDLQGTLPDQIRQAVFPKLIPRMCDDFQHVLINSNGSASNHVYNFSDGLKDQLYFKFNDIDITGLTFIKYQFATKGADAQVKVYLDSLGGQVIQTVDLPFTESPSDGIYNTTFAYETYALDQAYSGKHPLVFQLINTTAKAPDGLVTINEIELVYGKEGNPPALEQQQDKLLTLRSKADLTPIMKTKIPGFERSTRVFDRGSWLIPKEEVSPALPLTLAKDPSPVSDRLAFAQWLVSKENPLTARVIVNRIWEQLFGTGIVLTVEDFGTQAEPATHQELLDYLALRLMNEHQWSIKSLLKEILMSATYRQSSKVTAEKLELDPYNRWLSRGSRFRLSSEQIRDQALAVSGLLDRTIGGPSVMPPQPEGIWQVIYNAQKWETSPQDRYRRGLYTYWKRTSPYPSMVSFDSPSREFCVSRRIRTNTPLQALITLNDPVFVEAAQALADKMKAEGELSKAISKGYYLALMKQPPPQTLELLAELYQNAEEELTTNPVKPVSLRYEQGEGINDPMTVVANAILNLDSFIMKE